MTDRTDASGPHGPWLRDAGPRRLAPAPRGCAGLRERLGKVSWIAFGLAAFVPPITVGLIGAPLMFPLVAVVVGLPAYLLLGLPTFAIAAARWHDLREREGATASNYPVLSFTLAALIANLFSPLVYLLFEATLWSGRTTLGDTPLEGALAYMLPGFVFAPVYAAIFAAAYCSMASSAPRPTVAGSEDDDH